MGEIMIYNTCNNSMKRDDTLYRMSELFEWDKWMREIPSIPMKRNWRMSVIPPFGGAVVRFIVHKGNASVSVYLDCYDKLGCMDMKPYWEIHPSVDGDCKRFWMHEVDELVDEISKSLASQERYRYWSIIKKYFKRG
jgi:hypothetical protein